MTISTEEVAVKSAIFPQFSKAIKWPVLKVISKHDELNT